MCRFLFNNYIRSKSKKEREMKREMEEQTSNMQDKTKLTLNTKFVIAVLASIIISTIISKGVNFLINNYLLNDSSLGSWRTTISSIIHAIVLTSVLVYINQRMIIKPLKKISVVIEEFKKGNLDVSTINIERKDEIGYLQREVNKMNIKFSKIVEKLADIIEDVSAYSEELSASAQEGNAAVETTNQLVESISAGIQEISASSEEVTSFAEESASQTELGNKTIKETVDSIKEINYTVRRTVKVINDLDDKSEEIGDIVDLITNIAEQTNLLALNAAIEAARAGEHGQGFAVVADEIRELAEETNKATGEIANLVNEIQEETDEGLEAINKVEVKAQEGEKIAEKAGEVFKTISDSSEQTAVQIEQTASATQDLAESSDKLINTSQDIVHMTDEIADSSLRLAEMGQNLQGVVDEFDI